MQTSTRIAEIETLVEIVNDSALSTEIAGYVAAPARALVSHLHLVEAGREHLSDIDHLDLARASVRTVESCLTDPSPKWAPYADEARDLLDLVVSEVGDLLA